MKSKAAVIISWLLAIIIIVYILFVIIAPPIVESDKNKVTIQPPYNVSATAQKIIDNTSFIGDLHSDALLWKIDLTKRSDRGHVDFPRMREGGVAFQAFTIVTKSPQGQNFNENSADAFDMITALCIGQGQPPRTWFSLMNRALYQCKKLHRYAKKSKEKVIVIKSKNDIERLLAERESGKNTIGGLLGIEGGHCLEGKLENLDRLYSAGVRMLGPTHFFDNEMGGSAHGTKKEGLTEFGQQVIRNMKKKGMIVDIAHSSEQVVDDILKIYNGPILSSHTGVDGTYSSLRNLSDKQLISIAKRKGLIGIAYFPGAVGSGGIKAIVKAMKYTKDLIGIDYVALGSDFDGSVSTPIDVTGIGLIVDEMLRQQFSETEIKAILGDNLKRFLLENL